MSVLVSKVSVFQRQFDGVAQSARLVRQFVDAAVLGAGWSGEVLDNATLVADELVTNVLQHTDSGLPGGVFSVRVYADPAGLVAVHVRDAGSQDEPHPGAAAEDAESGRGLTIVRILAADYGTGPAERCVCEGEPYARCSWASIAWTPATSSLRVIGDRS